jgi:lysophospholipase L1-like esterase
MTTPEVEALKRSGYNPTLIYENNDRLRRCVNFLTGTPGFGPFNDLGNSLHYNDPYMVLADFEAYRAARAKSAELYKQPEVWQKMSLMNVASSGIFCADRAVEEYARNIRRIIRILRKIYPGVPVFFATTTPMNPGETGTPKNRTTEELALYNRYGMEAAEAEGAPVDDLFALAITWDSDKFADNCHFNAEGNALLGHAVSGFLREKLGL